MAGEPEDEDFLQAQEEPDEDFDPRSDQELPVAGTVRALRDQFEQVRETRVSTSSTISSTNLHSGVVQDQDQDQDQEQEGLVLCLNPSFESQKGRELDPRFFLHQSAHNLIKQMRPTRRST